MMRKLFLMLMLLPMVAMAQDGQEEVKQLLRGVAAGDYASMHKIAEVYYEGKVVAQDLALAKSYAKMAYEKAHKNADLRLLYNILAKQKKYDEGLQWLRLSIDKGKSSLYDELANAYYRDIKDYTHAVYWATIAIRVESHIAPKNVPYFQLIVASSLEKLSSECTANQDLKMGLLNMALYYLDESLSSSNHHPQNLSYAQKLRQECLAKGARNIYVSPPLKNSVLTGTGYCVGQTDGQNTSGYGIVIYDDGSSYVGKFYDARPTDAGIYHRGCSLASASELFNQAYSLPSSSTAAQLLGYYHVTWADPSNSEGLMAAAYNNIGFLYAGMGEWELAEQFYEMSISVSPGFEIAANNLKDIKRRKRGEKIQNLARGLAQLSNALGAISNTLSGNSYSNSYNGGSSTYSTRSSRHCTNCAGTGNCPKCRGNGRILSNITQDFRCCPVCNYNCSASRDKRGKCTHCGGTGRR